MEPMVVFSAVLVVYYAYLALLDVVHDLRRDLEGGFLETAIKRVKPARPDTAAHVMGIEKLSKTLGVRGKRLCQVASSSPIAWRREGAL
jgi:hypothetical protein